MNIYIRSAASISPQPAFGDDPLSAKPAIPIGNRLRAIEPDYSSFIDPKQIRRMSRIVKMGVAAAHACLREAGETMPGAIVTGTAYGCLEDTGIFLSRLIEQQEEMLSPTSFIQSTHNTVGAQIALMLQCTNYNNTFVHRGFSFESALLDAMMLLWEGAATTVLAGSVDEITDSSHAILERFGLYRRRFPPIAGEGAAFFLLAGEPTDNDYAQLEGLHTFYRPHSIGEVEDQIRDFLSARSLTMEDIDLVLSGGHPTAPIFKDKECIGFKHGSGEYPTASSFALAYAASILRAEKTIHKRILIYNHYLDIHHSLMLVSKC